MSCPEISIIIPTYNRGSLILETLESVKQQTFENWECIIVDDGSTDETGKLVGPICEKDHRIKYFERPETWKKGASSCRNYGFERSKGNYIQFLDSDDILGENKLLMQINMLKRSRMNSLATSKWGYFQNINQFEKGFKFRNQTYRNFNKGEKLLSCFGFYNEFFPPHVYLTPRSLITKSGGWNEELTNNDDGEFFTRVILSSTGIVFVPTAEVFYRMGNGNKLSSLKNSERILSAIKSIKLIEAHLLQKRSSKSALKYVKSLKWRLYTETCKNFPELIYREEIFFSGKKDYNSGINSLFKRIRNF